MGKNKAKEGKSAFRPCAVIYLKMLRVRHWQVHRITFLLPKLCKFLFFLWQRAGTDGRNKTETRTLWCKSLFSCFNNQKQSSRGVLKKRCSENTQQTYRRTPKPNCDFNNIALQLYKTTLSHGCFFCKFAAYFQKTFTQEHLCVAVSGQCEPSKWKNIFNTNHYVIRKDHKVFFANLYTDIVLFFAKSSLP